MEFSDRLIDLALLQECPAEIVVARRIVGVDFQRPLVVNHRFVHLALFEEDFAEIVVG